METLRMVVVVVATGFVAFGGAMILWIVLHEEITMTSDKIRWRRFREACMLAVFGATVASVGIAGLVRELWP